MKLFFILFCTLFVNCFGTLLDQCENSVLYSWEGGPLNFPSRSVENLCTLAGQYIPKNIVATKIILHLHKFILLTTRFKEGNPSSLVVYDTLLNPGNPIFNPYPNLESHEEGNCQAIQNAVDFFKDHLGFLWVLDTGTTRTMEIPQELCPPKIVCISLVTHKILKTLDISDLVIEGSRLQNIVADYNHLGKAYLYISDAASGSVIVYDIEKDKGYRAILPETVSSGSSSCDTFYITIDKCLLGKSTLYLSYLDSPYIYAIPTEDIKKGKPKGKIVDVGTKLAPMIFLGMDKHKLYYRYRNDSSIYIWDVNDVFNPGSSNSIYTGQEGFLPMAIAPNLLKGSITVLQSNVQDYLSNSCGTGVVHQILDIGII